MIDVERIRRDFPILGREVYGKPLVYLDNAATTQKPQCVIDAISEAYCNVNANVHRGIHFLSQQATDMMEAARDKVRQFIGAGSTEEITLRRTIQLRLSAHTLKCKRISLKITLLQHQQHQVFTTL